MTRAPYPIRPIDPEEYETWLGGAVATFNDTARPDFTALSRALTEFDRTLAAFDGAHFVGTAEAYSFRMGVPGGLRPVAGISTVTVAQTHRRRGILRSLMERQLADVHERGEALAALFASESAIYGRFGYGAAARELSLTLRRGESALTAEAPYDEDLRVRVTAPGEARKELAAVYDAVNEDVAVARPGMFARDDAWWDKRLYDPEDRRHGEGPLQCAIVEDGKGPRGYALFSIRSRWDDDFLPDHRLTVKEIFGSDPAAYAAAWRHVLERDLVGTVVAQNRPVDEPLLWLLADPRRARARMEDNLWVRVVDVGAAMTQRTYSRPVDVVLDVRDRVCPWNAGRWRLSGGIDGATCERTSDPADVTMTARELGAAYLGAADLAAPAAAGLIREQRPGALRTLAAALQWDPRPWCPMVF